MRKLVRMVQACLCGLAIALVGCSRHTHVWSAATCTESATYMLCGLTEGKPLGHKWKEATCTDPQTCSVCGQTKGEALGHDWLPPSQGNRRTCRRCGLESGEVYLFDNPESLIADYEFGDYRKFGSAYADDDLVGTRIWFDATYSEVETLELGDTEGEEQLYLAFVTDEDGKQWCVKLELSDYASVDTYAGLANHQLCVMGEYLGYREKLGMPEVLMEQVYDRTTGRLTTSMWYQDLLW